MGGGGTPTSTTTTTNLSQEQKDILNLAMPSIKQYAAQPTTLPTSQLTASPTANQTAGQQQALGAVGTQDALAKSGASSSDFLLNKALYPSSNPALQSSIDAAVRPISQQLTDVTLPAIRGEATTTGNFGGSRQGIAEGIASRGASQAAGDVASQMANANYQAGLDAQVKALGLLPQTQTAQTAGALTTSGVGDVQQAQTQAQLDEAAYRNLYAQLEPLYRAQGLTSIGSAIPGGSATTTGSTGSVNPLTSALGGASLGTALLGPGVGTAAGAGLGGLLAFL